MTDQTDLFIPEVEKRALEIWREREMTLPERTRRMSPDAIDKASGAWWACMIKAGLELRASR